MKPLAIVHVVLFLLGNVLTYPTGISVGDKVHDIIDLIPKERISELAQQHMQNDEGFKAAIFYLQGKEWNDLLDALMQKPEFIKFEEITKQMNLNITGMIMCIKSNIFSLQVNEEPTSKPDLTPFIKEVEESLPLAKMITTLTAKGSDEDAVQSIQVPFDYELFQKILDDLLNVSEMKTMLDKIKEMGFDLKQYIGFVHAFFEWVLN
ncbi:uncharacterized protein LOC132698473 [Cylas formicarius]|uniref:uncharacterized protein LOC132698473 n=1 Tax=Cylas formicarius TaxID=197179 RepID=UPI002958A619|nr:uncharacterized protein LOC132698473 [Cylas formicarius]